MEIVIEMTQFHVENTSTACDFGVIYDLRVGFCTFGIKCSHYISK